MPHISLNKGIFLIAPVIFHTPFSIMFSYKKMIKSYEFGNHIKPFTNYVLQHWNLQSNYLILKEILTFLFEA